MIVVDAFFEALAAQWFERSPRSESVRNEIIIFGMRRKYDISNAPNGPISTYCLLIFDVLQKTKSLGVKGT